MAGVTGKIKVNDAKLRGIQKEIARAGELHVQVGILAGEGGDADHGGITILELAAIHEFGSPAANIPARSFIGRTLTEREKEIVDLAQKLVKKIFEGKMTAEKALEVMGQFAAAEIKKRVTTGDHIPPPLQEATKAAKGSDRPLVDTGQMINSISHKVMSGDE